MGNTSSTLDNEIKVKRSREEIHVRYLNPLSKCRLLHHGPLAIGPVWIQASQSNTFVYLFMRTVARQEFPMCTREWDPIITTNSLPSVLFCQIITKPQVQFLCLSLSSFSHVSARRPKCPKNWALFLWFLTCTARNIHTTKLVRWPNKEKSHGSSLIGEKKMHSK